MWRPRDENCLADALANRALDYGNEQETFEPGLKAMLDALVSGAAGGFEECQGWLWARFDGASRVRGGVGVGEAAYGAAIDWVRKGERFPIFRESWRIGKDTAQAAEMRGAARSIRILLSILVRLAEGEPNPM
jgi:hypothetical protein